MSKSKKFALALVVALAAGAGGKYYYEGTPYLIGKCYSFYGKVGVQFAAKVTVPTEDGKTALAYGTIMQVGGLALPKLLPVRETNRDMPALIKSGTAVEVDCATGK